MPRAARKLMITGKGRCNFTNEKPRNQFSSHIRNGERLVKSAFYNFTPEQVLGFFESFGTPCVVERGERAFPQSYHAGDIVDTLVNACYSVGVKYETEVLSVLKENSGAFRLTLADGNIYTCDRLIIATGGLSYPSTGSTGDGYRWASALGHKITQTFPSLTALVPRGYKLTPAQLASLPQAAELELPSEGKCHIHRNTPLSETAQKLLGIQLKNVGAKLFVQDNPVQEEFGDIDFTDGGIEGPIGFQLSRKAVKALVNGSKVALELDLKPGVLRLPAMWDMSAALSQRDSRVLKRFSPRPWSPAFATGRLAGESAAKSL